jgi:2'-5' RNA ligase
MQGIVSMLDPQTTATVEALWTELEQQFGLRYARTAYPHFSYQVVERYVAPTLEPILRRLAEAARPLRVTTSGLGIFTGERPVLYVRVVRDGTLSAFHRAIYDAALPLCEGMHDYYVPALWNPHITLAMQDLTHEMLPDVIRLLSRRPFQWNSTVDSLSLVLNAQGTRDNWRHYLFGGDC